jgi:glycosyltransferase involved in cell wall biosynthesis
MKAIKECTIFDLRVTQTNQDRGIPRYMHNLVMQIAKDCPGSHFYFMLDCKLPLPLFYDDFKAFGRFFSVEEGIMLFKKKHIHNYFISCYPIDSANQNFFEFLFPSFLYGHSPYIFGMIWDLIPLIFPDRYIGLNNKRDYMSACAAMREADHLFAISDHSAKDASRLLNIDHEKITNVYGGVTQEILDIIHNDAPEENNQIFSIETEYKQQYFVYIAGHDYRKNLTRTIQAYSIFIRMCGRVIPPLMIICNMPKEAIKSLQQLIRLNGLKPHQDVFISGHLSDKDIVRLLKNAKGLIFPSLYEGLGLPILESYACGTPVIASNTSSMCEIVHPQCMFDPYDPENIAAKIVEFCLNSNLRRISLEFGENILKKLTWKNASALITPYFMLPPKQNQLKSIQPLSTASTLPIFSILPPDDSGIAEYTYATFKNAPWNIHFYHQFPSFKKQIEFNSKSQHQAFHHRLFGICNKLYDYQKVVFILGNSSHHVHGLNYLLNSNGTADHEKYFYLHDGQIMNLWYAYFKFNILELKFFLNKFYPDKKREINLCNSPEDIVAKTKISGVRPLCQLGKPKKILVNSQLSRECVIQDLNEFAHAECETLFLPIIHEDIPKSPVMMMSRSETWIAHFGCLAINKRPDILLEACKILNKRHSLKLIFAGYHLRESLSLLKSKLPDFVTLFDSPSHDQLMALMQQIDVAVQLRWPSDGAMSGVVNQLLNLHKPVIATDKGFFSELKDFLTLTPEGITPVKLAEVIEKTVIDKEKLSQNIAGAKQKYSLEVFFERFQNALQFLSPKS